MTMGQLYTIQDRRTVYCHRAMRANSGVWNAATNAWMFRTADDAANALADLFRATRPSIPMRETLLEMIADGTAAAAWGFDPAIEPVDVDTLDRDVAQRYLSAGYAVRRIFIGSHPLEDRPRERIAEQEAARRSAAAHRFRRTRACIDLTRKTARVGTAVMAAVSCKRIARRPASCISCTSIDATNTQGTISDSLPATSIIVWKSTRVGVVPILSASFEKPASTSSSRVPGTVPARASAVLRTAAERRAFAPCARGEARSSIIARLAARLPLRRDRAPPLRVVSHGRYVAFQMAEVAIPRNLFAAILQLIAGLRSPPACVAT